jgi:hypothetical protein
MRHGPWQPLLVGFDPLVDLVGVGAVVRDGGLDKTEGGLQVAGCLGGVAAVVPHGGDDLPDVLGCAREPGAPASGAFREPDKRMLVQARPF